MNPSTHPQWEFVLKKAWDPRWHHVILLLAGKLPLAPARCLLTRLADAEEDDAFRHRLALAAHCLPELAPSLRAPLAGPRDQIATEVVALWWKHRMNATVAAVPHLTRALAAVVRADARVDPGALGRPETRTMGRSPATSSNRQPLLDLLAELLRDADAGVQRAGARAVGGMGAAAATEPFLARLVELLRDADAYVRWAAAEAVRGIGAAAATEPILARLVELLRDANADVRGAGARAVGRLAHQGLRLFTRNGRWHARHVEELSA